MRLNISFTDNELSLFGNMCNQDYNLNLCQLNNISTYMDVVKKNQNNNTINNCNNIFQAIHYDMDEINNYWIVLDNNFMLYDIGIPLNA